MNEVIEVSDQITLKQSELGQASIYEPHYNPDRLFPISRAFQRQEIGVNLEQLPFYGFDCWNHYEVSWLNAKGKPEVAVAEIIYDCTTPFLIESKSLKLYFNSLNNTSFHSKEEICALIEHDLTERVKGRVEVRLFSLQERAAFLQTGFEGESLDDQDIHCSVYSVEPNFLSAGENKVQEVLYSDLLKSNCLVTNQPDWGSVQITYTGRQINKEGLLQYLVSFRNHNEFHEQCIERIFMDIMAKCQPETLTVYGRYTRRGGLDINPMRSTEKKDWREWNLRLIRQ
jgi:7-cyano-7-deazaguanine reductase